MKQNESNSNLAYHLNSLPSWATAVFPRKWIDKFAILFFKMAAYNAEMSKYRIGFLLKEILDRSQLKAINHFPYLSIYGYSAHDLTLATFLNALGMYDVCAMIYGNQHFNQSE